MSKPKHYRKDFVTPFGTRLGAYMGVEGYSNGNDRYYSGEKSCSPEHYYGVKWQCVEYARRWLVLAKGMTFCSVPTAADVWKLRHLDDVKTAQRYPMRKHHDGSPVPPRSGMILIWQRSFKNPFGHIAIVTDVNHEDSYVRIAEQNLLSDYWPGEYARQLKLVTKSGNYFIEDEDPITGWLEIGSPSDEEEFAKDYKGGKCY